MRKYDGELIAYSYQIRNFNEKIVTQEPSNYFLESASKKKCKSVIKF